MPDLQPGPPRTPRPTRARRLLRSRVAAAGVSVGAAVLLTAGIAVANPAPGGPAETRSPAADRGAARGQSSTPASPDESWYDDRGNYGYQDPYDPGGGYQDPCGLGGGHTRSGGS